ncbi:unnamed protein product [Cercospora beticola]|nr:unnamed protein product [Cercospora beticola]
MMKEHAHGQWGPAVNVVALGNAAGVARKSVKEYNVFQNIVLRPRKGAFGQFETIQRRLAVSFIDVPSNRPPLTYNSGPCTKDDTCKQRVLQIFWTF